MLVRWALAGRPQSVLDPSYGGCAVLRVALEELTALGASEAATMIHGADIDREAAMWAAHLVAQGVPAENLVVGDFLSLRAGRDLSTAGAVVGNPPYVRHHRLTSAAKATAVAAAAAAGVRLSGRSSLWAYFVIHAAGYVELGGRMALLLPGAVTHADYAASVIEHLESRFDDVLLVRVGDRIFADAEEETVVLLAAGAREAGDRVVARFAEVDDLAGLTTLLTRPMERSSSAAPVLDGVAEWKLGVVPAASLELLTRLLERDEVSRLGEVAQVKLGTVTGANSLFVVSDDDAEWLGAQPWTVPVVTRSAWLDRPVLARSAYSLASANAPRRLLVLPADRVDRRTRLGRYLTMAEGDGIPDRHHCRREPWWSLRNVATPDAFLPYTVAAPRGVVVNELGAASTNTVHQVSWLSGASAEQIGSRVLSTWSTVGRLCTELYGRHLGGGVLKLELSGAQRIPVVHGLDVPRWRSLSDAASAADAADAALLASNLGLRQRDLDALEDAAAMLAARRVGRRPKASVVRHEAEQHHQLPA